MIPKENSEGNPMQDANSLSDDKKFCETNPNGNVVNVNDVTGSMSQTDEQLLEQFNGDEPVDDNLDEVGNLPLANLWQKVVDEVRSKIVSEFSVMQGSPGAMRTERSANAIISILQENEDELLRE